MSKRGSVAAAIESGDGDIVAQLARSLLRLDPQNFVERPWGGVAMRRFKGIGEQPDSPGVDGAGLGEAFEIAACDDDPEARAHPSRVRLDDGSSVGLPALLARHGAALLGDDFARRHGGSYPLLPKVLDVKELLSVQAHPPGHTEAYIVIEAEPGATLRLGFNADVDADALRTELHGGLELQQLLIDMLEPDIDAARLQPLTGPWLADRRSDEHDIVTAIEPWLRADARVAAGAALRALKHCYWMMLDRLNAIEVTAGQVIHNATPARICGAQGREPSAEVHALGNPEQREILALEIRRPGPTFRAWDNVRFPRRDVDVDTAIAALNLRRTAPEDFVAEPVPIDGRPGVRRGIESAHYSIEHLAPADGLAVDVHDARPHSLHVLGGAATLMRADGVSLGALTRGETAIVPIGVGAYRIEAASEDVDIVRVSLPAAGERV